MPQNNFNTVYTDNDGIHFIPSGSNFNPLQGLSSKAQIFTITASSTGNQLVHSNELNPFFIITVLSSSNVFDNNDAIEIYRYHTASINLDSSAFGFSSSLFFTSSNSRAKYRNIPILSTDNGTTVATKTYNTITGSLFYNRAYSASLNSNDSITFTFFRSGAFATPTIHSASIDDNSLSFNYIQTGSGALNFVEPYIYNTDSSSLSLKKDPLDKDSYQFSVGTSSFAHAGGEEKILLYSSASGRIGIDTKDPLTDVDIRANEFQIQRKSERRGLKINTEGNIESFDKNADTAATGSEFILKYSRGITLNTEFINSIFETSFSDDADAQAFFEDQPQDVQISALDKGEKTGFITPPATDDVMGTIRWVAESGSVGDFRERVSGEAASIQAKVHSIDSTGVRGDLVFNVADKTGTSVQRMVIDAGDEHQLSGSLNVGGTDSVSAGIKMFGTTGNLQGGFFRVGSNAADLKIGRMLLHDDGTQKVQISAKGKSFIAGTSGTGTTGTFLGINTQDPTVALQVEGDISSSGFISASFFSGDGSGLTNVTATATIPAGTISSSLQNLGNITGSNITFGTGGSPTNGNNPAQPTQPTAPGQGGNGGASANQYYGPWHRTGAQGAAGAVIIRFPNTRNYTATGSPTLTTDGSDKILQWTTAGTYTITFT